MNVDTGELRKLASLANTADIVVINEDYSKLFEKPEDEESKLAAINKYMEVQKQLEEAEKNNIFTPIPEELEHAAEAKLKGQDSAMVSLTSGGKLSKWAAKQRKAKRKAEQEARRKNRRRS
jgi:ABC-type enterochelin transport system substrate-binding protein